MQEGRMAQGAAVGQGRRPLGGVENQLNTAVFDGIHDMGPAFQYLVDLGRLDALFRQVTLGSGRSDGLETERSQQFDRWQDARLVGVLDRNEDGAAAGQAGATADLTLGESDFKRTVDAHDLTGRFHLRSEHSVDAGEARKREYSFFHRPVLWPDRFKTERLELFTGHDPGCDLGDRQADDLRHEGDGARRTRIDLEHVDLAVLDGILHVHQAADVERECKSP